MVLDGKRIYKNLLLITLLFNSLYLASQDLYFKKFDPKYGCEEYGHSIHKSENGDIYLVKALTGKTSFEQRIYKIATSGEVKDSAQIMNGFLNTNDIIFDDQNLIVFGSEKSFSDTITVRKYDKNLILLDSVALVDRLKEFHSVFIHSSLEYNKQYVVSGTLFDNLENDSIYFKSFLLFINRDLTVDTIYTLNDTYRTQSLYSMDVSKDGLLTLITFVINQKFEELCCVYKLNKNHIFLDCRFKSQMQLLG